MNKQAPFALIAGLILLQLFTLGQIHSLQSRIEYSNHKVEALERQLSDQIGSIYETIDQQLEKQASLLHNTYTDVGRLDPNTGIVPITFTVEPKTVTDSLTVSLDFDGVLVPLKKTGLGYSVTKEFSLSQEVIFPTIVLEDKGNRQVEAPMEPRTINLREQLFPTLYAGFSGESSYGASSYRTKGVLHVDYKPTVENISFTDMRYVIKADDTIIEELPIILDTAEGSGAGFTLDIDGDYSVTKGQSVTSTVVATDSLGFTHEYLLSQYVAGASKQREPYLGKATIIAPNGDILFQSNLP